MKHRTKAERDADLDRFFAAAEDILTDWAPAGYSDAQNTEHEQSFRFENDSPPPLTEWPPAPAQPTMSPLDDLRLARTQFTADTVVSVPLHPNCRADYAVAEATVEVDAAVVDLRAAVDHQMLRINDWFQRTYPDCAEYELRFEPMVALPDAFGPDRYSARITGRVVPIVTG